MLPISMIMLERNKEFYQILILRLLELGESEFYGLE